MQSADLNVDNVRSARKQTRNWNLADEVVLDPAISAQGLSVASGPIETSLFTGASGFLGAHILARLLQRTSLRFICLVRASSRTDAARRVRANLDSYGLWRPEYEARLSAVPSDLDRPYLGLRKQTYLELAAQVDVVHHIAAWSNYVLPYALLKPANVLGTQEMLRFASTLRLKPLHFVSSTSIYPGHDPNRKFFPEAELTESNGVPPGYPQTKWVADKLVSAAGRRGIPISIYRVGQLAGHSITGVSKLDIFVTSMMKGAIQLGYTVSPDIQVELIPIDYAANAIAEISLKDGARGQVYNIVNRKTIHWNECVEALNHYGYRVERLAYQDWRAKLLDPESKFHENALYPYLPLFLEDMAETAHDLAFQVGNPVYETKNTEAGLAETDVACRALDESLMHVYLDYFVKVGYVAPPSHAAGSAA